MDTPETIEKTQKPQKITLVAKFTSLTYDGKVVEDFYKAETQWKDFDIVKIMKACNKGDISKLPPPVRINYGFIETLFENSIPSGLDIWKARLIETQPFKGLKYVISKHNRGVNKWEWADEATRVENHETGNRAAS